MAVKGHDPETLLDTEQIAGCITTREMVNGAILWRDEVTALEKHVEVEAQFKFRDNSTGKVDAWAYHLPTCTLYIWDYKFGHVVVEPFENPTLVIYASAILKSMDLKVDEVVLTIVQPRASHRYGPVRQWTTTLGGIERLAQEIDQAGEEASQPNPVCRSGPHCMSCEARHDCETCCNAAMAAIDYAASPTPQGLNAEQVGREALLLRRAEEAIKARRTGLESEIEGMIRGGVPVLGWTMKETFGHLAWTESPNDVAVMGDFMGMDLRKPLEVMTPTQAKNAGFNKEILDQITQRPARGHKLQPVDNKEARLIMSQFSRKDNV